MARNAALNNNDPSAEELKRAKKDLEKALADYTEGVRLDPKSEYGFRRRGGAWAALGAHGKAAADYETAIKVRSNSAAAHNALAWLRATCPDAKHRDGEKAADLAKRACELTSWKNAGYIDTLAAAHAELGNFKKAAEYLERALDLPGTTEAALQEFRERLKLYEAEMPYRQPPPAKKE